MSKPSIGIMARYRNQVCQYHTLLINVSMDYVQSINAYMQLDAIRTYCKQERVPNIESVSYIPTYYMQGTNHACSGSYNND